MAAAQGGHYMELVSEFDFILWLVESYSRLHGNLNLWEKQELFSAYAKGEEEYRKYKEEQEAEEKADVDSEE